MSGEQLRMVSPESPPCAARRANSKRPGGAEGQ